VIKIALRQNLVPLGCQRGAIAVRDQSHRSGRDGGAASTTGKLGFTVGLNLNNYLARINGRDLTADASNSIIYAGGAALWHRLGVPSSRDVARTTQRRARELGGVDAALSDPDAPIRKNIAWIFTPGAALRIPQRHATAVSGYRQTARLQNAFSMAGMSGLRSLPVVPLGYYFYFRCFCLSLPSTHPSKESPISPAQPVMKHVSRSPFPLALPAFTSALVLNFSKEGLALFRDPVLQGTPGNTNFRHSV